MKIYLKSSLLFLAFLVSNCEKNNLQEAIIVRDCTGVYLQMNGQDFFVCNREKLDKFEAGDDVKVSVQSLKSCDNNFAVCLMLHQSAGIVKVNQVVNK